MLRMWGIPSGIPGEGIGRRCHTPCGQSRTGAADLKALPLPPAPLSLLAGWAGCC